jgi:hypothetical protein
MGQLSNAGRLPPVLWRVCEELHYELLKMKKVLARGFVTTLRLNREMSVENLDQGQKSEGARLQLGY